MVEKTKFTTIEGNFTTIQDRAKKKKKERKKKKKKKKNALLLKNQPLSMDGLSSVRSF